MQKGNRFMRLLVMFDLPTESKEDLREYRRFSKFLKTEGFLMVQFSIYSKLCINADSAETISRRLEMNAPFEGDIRYLIVTERQYQNIIKIQGEYSLQEEITTSDRFILIGGMNNENNKRE